MVPSSSTKAYGLIKSPLWLGLALIGSGLQTAHRTFLTSTVASQIVGLRTYLAQSVIRKRGGHTPFPVMVHIDTAATRQDAESIGDLGAYRA